jgi:hypothetical protein
MIGGLWHPNRETDDEDAAANRAMHWAGLIDKVMSDSSDEGDGAGFGFVCAIGAFLSSCDEGRSKRPLGNIGSAVSFRWPAPWCDGLYPIHAVRPC